METFIVRVWTPSPELADEVARDELRGMVERVGSKEQFQFGNAGDLLEIVRSALRASGGEASGEPKAPDRASRDNAA